MMEAVKFETGFALDRDGNQVPLTVAQRAIFDRLLARSFEQTRDVLPPPLPGLPGGSPLP